jgi:hypothetical protein
MTCCGVLASTTYKSGIEGEKVSRTPACMRSLSFAVQGRDNAHKVVIAVWAEFVGLLEPRHILSKGLLALLAEEGHLDRLLQLVVCLLGVTLGALRYSETSE